MLPLPPSSRANIFRAPTRFFAFTILVAVATVAVAAIHPLKPESTGLWLEHQREGLAGPGLEIAARGAAGTFLRFRSEQPKAEHEFSVGQLLGMKHFRVLYRKWSACWSEPTVVPSAEKIPAETQFILMQAASGRYLLLVPLLDGAFRCSLWGEANDELKLRAESGDPAVTTRAVTGLYCIAGDDPYELVREAAREIRRHLGQPEIAVPVAPDFIDYLGWCSWNAFYATVSQEKLEATATAFARGGTPLGLMIVDAGWQTSHPQDKTVTGPDADPLKFKDGIPGIVRALKQDHGVRRVMLWQTFNGFWRGLAKDAIPGVEVTMLNPSISERFPLKNIAVPIGPEATVSRTFYPSFFYKLPVSQPDFAQYYSRYHDFIASRGADGVKIDAISWIETMGRGRGGRVAVARTLLKEAGHSAATRFAGNVLLCSSHSNDIVLQAPRSSVMRTSHDFFPDIPASHGLHVFNNAMNSLWMGEWIIPDWDMFQSGHAAGEFHAAARAISGGPVYSTDAPESANFDVLRRLTLSDRTVPRCTTYAKPSVDSLFYDPQTSSAPLKIFNYNATGGVVGLFNCGTAPQQGAARAADVPGLGGDRFVLYTHRAETLTVGDANAALRIQLKPLEYELCTVIPIVEGFGPVGLTEKMNSGGTFSELASGVPGVRVLRVRDGGRFVAYSATKPIRVLRDGAPIDARHDPASGRLELDLPAGKAATLSFHWR